MLYRLKLIWQLYPAYLLVMLAALFGFAGYVVKETRTFYGERAFAGVQDRLCLVEAEVSRRLAAADGAAVAAELDGFCKKACENTTTRITVILPDGRVAADSAEDPRRMDNHLNRPEVRDALANHDSSARRWSHTRQQDAIYVARPIHDPAGRIRGVLRVSMPVTVYEESLAALRSRTLLAAALLAVAVAAVSLLIARHIARPLREMRDGARRVAAGDFSRRLRIRHSVEIDSLAQTLNEMAAQLDERFRTITRQRNEIEAILAGMSEGVVAVDENQCVLSLNAAAAVILDVSVSTVKGRPLVEAVRNRSLQELLSRALTAGVPAEGETVLGGDRERMVQVRAAPLPDSAGAVAVLLDVTRLRRLENLRREFVANVSHELRTPITAIQGFVETLQDGALDDPAQARRFLEIIGRQSARLDVLINDLLQLSRLESETETGTITLEACDAADLARAAIQAAGPAATESQVRLNLACSELLPVRVNPNLFQQAVANLVDNAIKYSTAGGQVLIRGWRDTENRVLLSVQDNGCGIAKEHQERIFERFYRVDKARSRELGGTGLGLAIVKHIMQVHGGQVTVESEPGQGSTFTLRLPAA